MTWNFRGRKYNPAGTFWPAGFFMNMTEFCVCLCRVAGKVVASSESDTEKMFSVCEEMEIGERQCGKRYYCNHNLYQAAGKLFHD